MPFFDNTGVDLEVKRGPLWGAFASLFEQLERLIALNIAWALQLVPLMMAAIFPDWPGWLRLLLLLYTGVALALMTGLLYGVAGAAVAGESIRLELARDLFAELAPPSLLTLVPLYGMFGILISLITWIGGRAELFFMDVAARLLLLLVLVCSMYWGPLFAEHPHDSALSVARQSMALAWREPVRTLLVLGAVVVVALLGTVSVGGVFLVAPVLIALLQTHMYRTVTRRA